MSTSQFPKVCTCCRKAVSKQEWNLLRYVGRQADDVETLEMRDCTCGSTLCVRLELFVISHHQRVTERIQRRTRGLAELLETHVNLALESGTSEDRLDHFLDAISAAVLDVRRKKEVA